VLLQFSFPMAAFALCDPFLIACRMAEELIVQRKGEKEKRSTLQQEQMPTNPADHTNK